MSIYPLMVWCGLFAWLYQCGWFRIGMLGMILVFTWYLNWGIRLQ